ncbi:isoleucine--tRNA ligase [Candidatus Pacearchaeota archaeon]|nr:isoleucine--tRNA ligase [Candidatus Pacearchaeota archaeon]|tara:strand:+ start:1344 stop:4193 length:2850 start_codon:yes stop_codon:yes gene_type:complete
MDFKEIESEMLKFWDENDIYKKSKLKNAKGKKFYFLQGPPYTSGKLHIGHAWNNAMKDVALRFFRLKGFDVWDRAGYDMHGLPTANKVQKELGIKDKDGIIEYGLDKFNTRCQEFSTNAAKEMNEDLKRIGIWMDFEDPYLPVTNEFMSSQWALFKKAFEQDRLYKGKKIMHWCRDCETSLAKHELEYKNTKDNSIFLKFKIKDKENEYLIIWTTTPWTVLHNMAVMAGPEIDYVKTEVKTEDEKEKWIIAKNLAGVFISGLLGLESKTLEEFKGREMEGLEYVHPFYEKIPEVYDKLKKEWPNVHTVILSDKYVDTTAGSGLVHCGSGCGPEDFEVAQEYEIGAFNTLNEKGELEGVGEFSGMVAKKDDKQFVEKLKEVGSLIKQTPVEHEYAHCWRCASPVVFRTTEQWFLRIEDLVPKILEYDKDIKWQPEFAKKNYESWITNLKDNGVTRQRFWGTPMPLWECKCGEIDVIGSSKELGEKAVTPVPENLHKPWIDEVKLTCPKCGEEMTRVTDVIDVWIDSGTTSWNCLYYPEKEEIFKKYFPADLIMEATEQTRLWFSMLQLCSTIMFGKPCYKGAYNHGMIFDFEGTKMSKSIGNIISPYEVIDKYSSEIFRYYICQTTAGKNINFNWEDVKQKQRNLLVLLNTNRFLIQLGDKGDKKAIGIEEKYILSRLNSTIKKVTKLFEDYKFDETIGEIENLFLDISRVYIRFVRDKANENPQLVKSVLEEVYTKTLQMFSTICPLFTENIWQSLREKEVVKEESIHLSNWPKVDDKKIDEKLELRFNSLSEIIEAGLRLRDKEQIGLKWPLASVELAGYIGLNEDEKEIIKSQLNVKKILQDKDRGLKSPEIKLDTKLTPALEAEGFAREICRRVQAGRRKAELVKEDKIELSIESEFDELLEKQEGFIKERVGAASIKLESKEANADFTEEGKVKNKAFTLSFKKI